MALPLIGAIAAFIARQGVKKAVTKFGRKAVQQAQKSRAASAGKDALAKVGKRRRTTTKQERKEGREGSALQPDKGGRKPGKKTQAARRAANKAADVVRGAKRVGGVGTGIGTIGTVALAPKATPPRPTTPRTTTPRTPPKPKPTVTRGPTGATARSGTGGGGVSQTTRVKTIPKPDTRARATATRTDVTKAREGISGLQARPTTPHTSLLPPRPTGSGAGGTGSPSSPKGGRRSDTAAIVGAGATGVERARRNPRTVAEAKKRGKRTFIGKDARKKAAVTKEELEASGLSLRDYLNRERGLKRREGMKKGGTVKKAKTAKKANTGKTVKVRGVGIAKKGFRPVKMR